MRLKINLLVFVFGLLGGLSACSSEEIIDSRDNNDQTCDISLILSMGDMRQTKAATNYAYATEKELKISSCHVAVFEVNNSGDPTSRIYYKDFSTMGGLKSNVIGQLSGYELELNGVRTFGKKTKKVKVLVVANGDNAAFTNWKTYKNYVEGTLTTTSFQEESLVKVGLSSEATLTYGQESPTEISVKLNQLSAKIIYEGIFNVDDLGKPNADFSLTKVSGINMQSKVAIFSTSAVENDVYAQGTASSTPFYTYETTDTSEKLILSIQKRGTVAQQISFDANQFVKGNLYKIKGTYNPTAAVKIKWKVESFGVINIPVKPFE